MPRDSKLNAQSSLINALALQPLIWVLRLAVKVRVQ